MTRAGFDFLNFQAALLSEVSDHHDEISGLAIRDQGFVVSSCLGGEIRFWKLNDQTKTLKLLATIGPLSGSVNRLAVSQDANTLFMLIDGESAARIMRLDMIREGLRKLGVDW